MSTPASFPVTVFLGVDSQEAIEPMDEALGWIVSSGCVNVPMRLEVVELSPRIREVVKLISVHRGIYRESARGSDMPYVVTAEMKEALKACRLFPGPDTILRPGDCLRLRVEIQSPSRVLGFGKGEDLTAKRSVVLA